MEFEGLAKDIHDIFQLKQYRWKIDGELVVPTFEDIFDTIEEVLKVMQFNSDGTRFEVGRLIFQKTGDMVDIYVLQGTIQYNSEDDVDSEKSDNQGDEKE